MSDYYEVLGVDLSATPEEVKKGYFEMAKKYHPDSGDETEVKKFHEVAEAYKVLSDPDTRKAYDISIIAKDSAQTKAQPSAQSYEATPEEHKPHYRNEELKNYHQGRFKKAIFRVVAFSALITLIAYSVALILGGTKLGGVVSGLLIGVSFGVNKNFNVRTFFDDDRLHKAYHLATWILPLVGFGYFVWLIVKDLV